MTIETLTKFFMWCTIINSGLLLLWAFMLLVAKDLVYRTQTKFIELPREKFELVMYSFLAGFKMLVIVFNLVPWLALLILNCPCLG